MNYFQQHRHLLLAAGAALLTAFVLLFNRYQTSIVSNSNQLQSIQAVAIGKMTKPFVLTRNGAVEKAAFIPVTADFTGLLTDLYVKEGETVSAGQKIGVLKATEDTLTEVSAAPQQSAAPSANAQTAYENAQKEVSRLKQLYEIGGVSRKQFEAATARLQTAQEALDNPQPGAAQAVAGITKGTAVTITAPTSGIIMGLSAVEGGNVQAGQKLLSLGSGQEVEVVVRLSQSDLYLVHLGTPVTVGTAQQTVTGQVAKIYPQIEADQASAFLAHIKLAGNPDGFLQTGMTTTVQFVDIAQTSEVPAIPTKTIHRNKDGKSFLYLSVNGKAVLQEISLGASNDDWTELTSALPEQSLILVGNTSNLKPGDDVAINQE